MAGSKQGRKERRNARTRLYQREESSVGPSLSLDHVDVVPSAPLARDLMVGYRIAWM
jgi:hypothetical protein